MTEPEVPDEVRVLIWNRQSDMHRVAVTLDDGRRGHADAPSFGDAVELAIFNAMLSSLGVIHDIP